MTNSTCAHCEKPLIECHGSRDLMAQIMSASLQGRGLRHCAVMSAGQTILCETEKEANAINAWLLVEGQAMVEKVIPGLVAGARVATAIELWTMEHLIESGQAIKVES